jgi:GTP-binding protein
MKAIYVTSAAKPGQLPASSLPEYAFFGRSNVGKSSLLNKLLNHTGLARTSRTPGRTQMANFFAVNDKWHLVDLPGYGYSKTANLEHREWQDLMQAYIDRPQILKMLFLWDPRRDLDEIDWDLMYALGGRAPVVFIMTKCDKLNRSEIQQKTKFFENEIRSRGIFLEQVFAISTLKGNSVDDLRKFLFEAPQGV